MARFDIVDVETSNVYNQVLTSQKIQLGNVTKATLDTTLTGQIGLTVDQFNALSNDANQRGLKISSLFNDSSKVSGVLFSKESYYMPLTGIYANVQYKPNSVDSASFTVPTLDPAIYGTTIRVVLIESVSLTQKLNKFMKQQIFLTSIKLKLHFFFSLDIQVKPIQIFYSHGK